MSGVRLAILVLAVGGYGAAWSGGAAAGQPEIRPVMQDNYPRAFFFRASESMAANGVPYEQWDRTFSRLMGIMGKTLEEEVLGRSKRNIDFFTRFKRAHPRQAVLLHYNGNARDPRDQKGRFFAGHWVYYNGAQVLSDVPAEAGETDIRVSDPRLFQVRMGRYRTSNEDVGLCELDAKGRPNWRACEQVQLVSVDAGRKTIRVKRGCYGTRPRAFEAGGSYAAAHVTEGPWGSRNNIMWYYNYSLTCPRDAAGRTCSDVLVDDLCELFLEGGRLAAFDGIEFDVLRHSLGGGRRGPDVDADGKADGGVIDGRNVYGAGVVEFCRALRKRFGEDRLIMADGFTTRNQRALGILNGLESEGWPSHTDPEIRDWSGGMNRHFYWDANAREPKLNYINHKYTQAGDAPGKRIRPKVPFSTHRLVFAVAVFTNSAICYSFTPPAEAGEAVGVWDELRMGMENKLGWLGRPLAPAVRVAKESRNVLPSILDKSLLARISGENVKVSLDDGRLKIVGTNKDSATMKFRLAGVPCGGPDLFVSLVARGKTEQGMPPEVPRRMYVGAGSGDVLTGFRKELAPYRSFMTWVGREDFESGFYYNHVASGTVDLEFSIEGTEPLWISRIEAHAAADVMYREFENGVVLANPAPHPYTFDLTKRFPGQTFRRLRGSSRQDPETNNGQRVEATVTLGPKDALFLVREKAE